VDGESDAETCSKGKGHPATGRGGPKGVPGRLRPQIFLTFGTTRVVGCQPYALATFTPGEIPGTQIRGRVAPGHMVPSGATEKSPVTDTTGNRSRDLPSTSAVP
jgi:hypothetical protein